MLPGLQGECDKWLRSHFTQWLTINVCVTPTRGQVTCISYHLINSYQCLGESWMGCYGLLLRGFVF